LFTLAHQPVESYPLAKEPLYLNEVIAECVRAARVLATRKGLLLNTGALSEVSLLGDEELLKRMLLNLLDNAVKYTPEGGRISVALERNGHFARISVTDTGIGIPMEDQSRIFDRFYRVDKPRSRALGGAGLGLSIVRWIVDAHGGSLALESEIGRGSSFFVTLPLTS
jgi:signal transduction histidine kinase